jgi:Rps23 Pro-64 3,4-dihydroxylase Tpa1-like proline 4-hydroxylase
LKSREHQNVLNVLQQNDEVLKINPEYNSLVLFNVKAQAMHYVSIVKDCAGERGQTAFSGWLHKPT